MKTYNDAILRRYGTFLVSPPESLQFADHSPFGLSIDWHINPLHMRAAGFLDLLQKLDGLTFGPEGMPMDKWVFYDCSELPGFIYGFAVPHTELTHEERAFFSLPDDYEGPVPLSMYIAIPMHEPGTWFGHNLASLNRQLPKRELHHLGTITKSLAMKAYRIERLVGATQWSSKAVHIHTKFGPLQLLTAYTPAHSLHETLTYAIDVNDTCLRLAAGDLDLATQRPQPTEWLRSDDIDHMKRLQSAIEGGSRFELVGPPTTKTPIVRHPLRQVT